MSALGPDLAVGCRPGLWSALFSRRTKHEKKRGKANSLEGIFASARIGWKSWTEIQHSEMPCLKQLVFSFKFFQTCQKRSHGQLYLPPRALICSLRSNTVSPFLPKYDTTKLTGHSTCFESQLPRALRITSPLSLILIL